MARTVTRSPARSLPSPLLAWLVLCGLLSGVTLAQQLTSPLAVGWWIWAVTPPVVMLTALLLRKRKGSRLFAAGVMLTVGWVSGAALRLLLWVILTAVLKSVTG